MTIYLTRKQYDLLSKVFAIMIPFYKNNIRPLFEEVGKQYGTESAVSDACGVFENVPVTGPVPKYVKELTSLQKQLEQAESINIKSAERDKATSFAKKFTFQNTNDGKYPTSKDILVDALDSYSRVLMGQFFIIYEQLDVNSENEEIQAAWSAAKWNGVGVLPMRDLLIPDLVKMGWHGSFGIASSDNRYDSKLAYEMLKRIRNRRDDYILRVTDQPLVVVEEC